MALTLLNNPSGKKWMDFGPKGAHHEVESLQNKFCPLETDA